jgi:DNA (cytosine-5)-methyltransferase 1
MNELALFAGAGGGILGGGLLGWRTVCAVEWEQYPASVLCARQNDGLLPPFPIWDDVQTFDGKPWRGIVDVVSGGFPCQDISAAGKGVGIDGERSGMWREMARIIHEVRPRFALVENSPMLTSRGLGTVLGDLASMGFDARWGVLGAADVGANHQRDRIWIVAKWRGQLPHAQLHRIRRWEQQQEGFEEAFRKMANANSTRCQGHGDSTERGQTEHPKFSLSSQKLADTENQGDVRRDGFVGVAEEEHEHRGSQSYGSREWWKTEPNVGRVVDGVAARVDRLKAIGNGQVPLCAATAFSILSK